jgi:hypothetical protein
MDARRGLADVGSVPNPHIARVLSVDEILRPDSRRSGLRLTFLPSTEIKKPLVFVVGSYPEPVERIFLKNREGSVATTDADGPDVAGLLELEGWMSRIVLPQAIHQLRPKLDPGR